MVRVHPGATRLANHPNYKSLPVPSAVRDPALQLYPLYIAELERVQMRVRVNFYD